MSLRTQNTHQQNESRTACRPLPWSVLFEFRGIFSSQMPSSIMDVRQKGSKNGCAIVDLMVEIFHNFLPAFLYLPRRMFTLHRGSEPRAATAGHRRSGGKYL